MSDFDISRRKFVKNSGMYMVATTVLPLGKIPSFSRSLRFGLVTDTHYADRENQGTRFYRDALMKMDEAIEVFNQKRLDFVIHLGDFKDEDEQRDKKDTLHYLETIEARFKRFNGPRYHCVGNHDVDSITKNEFLSHITNTNIATDKSYYTFTNSGFKCIVLDANYDRKGNDQFYMEGADWQDTNIPPEQIAWLKKTVSESDEPTLVFCHHPLFEFFKEGSKFHINNFNEVQLILNNSPSVIACFHGHVHEERYRILNGIHYITQLGQVDYQGIENNSFSVVSIDDKSIKIEGFKRTANKTLSL